MPLQGHTNWFISVSFSPDGTMIASGSADHTVRIWDVETGQAIGAPLAGHTGWVRAVSFLDRQTVASASDDGIRYASGTCGTANSSSCHSQRIQIV